MIGHAFVLDGYASGYFHINWGWGGKSNGYFLISALDPNTPGIGGSHSDYNDAQRAIIGIEPDDGSVTPADVAPTIYVTAFSAFASSVRRTEGFCYDSSETFILNYGAYDVTGYVGLRVTDQNGQTTYLASEDEVEMPVGDGCYGPHVSVPLSGFPTDQTQTYKVYPAFRNSANGQWYDMLTIAGTTNCINATTDGDNIYFATPPSPDISLKATDITLPEKVSAGSWFSLRAHISATGGEYNDTVYVYANSKQIGSAPVNVDEENSIDVRIKCKARSTAHTYTLYLKDKDGNNLNDGLSYTFEPSASAIGTISGDEPQADAPIYNLTGQYAGTRAARLAKGIYVQQGRKVVVK